MIATITSPPSEAHTLRSQGHLWLRLAAYNAGLVASAAVVGATAGVAGAILRGVVLTHAGDARTWLGATAALALGYGLHELGFIRLPMPQIVWQVPASWGRFGWTAESLLFGVVLGAEVFTFMPYASFYMLVLLEAALGAKGGAVLGIVYGVARITPTTLGIASSYYRRRNPAPLAARIMHATGLFHRVNGIVLVVVAAVLIGLLVTGFPPNGSARVAAASFPTLGPVPLNCHGSTPTAIGRFFGTRYGNGVGVGAYPVWAAGLHGSYAAYGPHAVLEWGTDPRDLAARYKPPHGFWHKMMWVMDPRFKGRVTLHGGGVYGGPPMWFELAGPFEEVTTTLVLDPRHLTVVPFGYEHPWPQFPGGLSMPRAGCYYITAQWPGGRWRITFAAGRSRAGG